jgi:hypothetical protein
MTAPKKPQDRLAKAHPKGPEHPFHFEHEGVEYVLPPAADVFDVGFARRNRNRSQLDQLFLIIEGLADEKTLAAIDSMKGTEFTDWQKEFFDHSGIELGE